VGLNGRFSNLAELEEELVPAHLVLAKRPGCERVRYRHGDQTINSVRMQCREQPGERRPPVMTDHVDPLKLVCIQQRNNVGGEAAQRVVPGFLIEFGSAHPAQVGGDHLQPVLHEHRDLMAPDVGGVRPAVQHQHRRPGPVLLDVQVRAVDGVPPGLGLRHVAHHLFAE
jgi:hypothetical protein